MFLYSVVSLCVFGLLFPFFILIAFFIKREDGGPVFFFQERIGLNGKPFDLIKFRTMHESKQGPYFTTDDDSRITKIGKVLRIYSLDELPQLLNVIKGDMSLVGPRPDVIAQKVLYTDEQWKERLSVRPGITGLAQVLYRSEATVEKRIALDIDYINNYSLWLDFKILLMTFFSIFARKAN